MESASPILPLSPSGRAESTGVSRASIIAAVAVLLMNMEKMEITRRKPRSTILGFFPKGASRILASVTSSPYLDAMMASTKPPRKSITTGSAKADIMLL